MVTNSCLELNNSLYVVISGCLSRRADAVISEPSNHRRVSFDEVSLVDMICWRGCFARTYDANTRAPIASTSIQRPVNALIRTGGWLIK